MTKRERNRQIEYRRQAEEATRNLRIGTSPLMVRIRKLPTEKGVDPGETIMIGLALDELYSHGGGELVLPDGDAVVFSLKWDGKNMGQAELGQWYVDNEVPSRATGLELLERERRCGPLA